MTDRYAAINGKKVLNNKKYNVYQTRENGSLDLKVLKRNIHKLKILKNK